MAQKSRWPGILFTLALVSVVVGYKAYFGSPEKKLVEHVVVSDSSLASKDGRRIEIRCNNPDLSKDDARNLVAHYEERAGHEGQVSIHKPDKDGNFLPWVVLNAGEPIKYQDYFFQ